jgi:hypothetical protein
MAFIVNPNSKTIEHWEPKGSFLPSLRDAIGCTQVDSIMIQKNTVAWVDNFGLLKVPQRFWRFKDSAFRFAGTVIVTGVDPDGMPCNIPDVPFEAMRQQIDWCEGDAVLRVRETLEVTPTEQGPWPRVVRVTDWNRVIAADMPPQPAQGQYMVAESEMPLGGPVPVSPTGPVEPPPATVPSPLPSMEALLATPAPEPAPAAPEASQEPAPDPFVWTVLSDDESDRFVAIQADAVTGEATGRQELFAELKDMTTFMKGIQATRLPDSPDASDEVVAVFSSPE